MNNLGIPLVYIHISHNRIPRMPFVTKPDLHAQN